MGRSLDAPSTRPARMKHRLVAEPTLTPPKDSAPVRRYKRVEAKTRQYIERLKSRCFVHRTCVRCLSARYRGSDRPSGAAQLHEYRFGSAS